MYCVRKMTEDLYWVGASERRLNLFENAYPLTNGVSYNSYLLLDEKTVLIDTVDKSVSSLFFENVDHVLGGRKLDYLIVQHMEPDHAATIGELVLRHPELTIVCNAKTRTMMQNFFTFDIDSRLQLVKEMDTLTTGRHTFAFVMAPMVHWPEVMVSYDTTTKTLYSADAFGTFGALNGNLYADEVNFRTEWLADARRYYTNIVGKYGTQVQTLLKKAAGLEIEMICPLHGPVWRKDIAWFLDKYIHWATYTPEDDGVVIAYASVYGGTENAANVLAAKLSELGVRNVQMYDVSVTHPSYILSECFRASHLVFISTTYNAGMFVTMENLVHDIVHHNLQNRTIALMENGSWAPTAAGLMRAEFQKLKNCTILDETVTIKSTLKEAQLADVDAMAQAIYDSMPKPAPAVHTADAPVVRSVRPDGPGRGEGQRMHHQHRCPADRHAEAHLHRRQQGQLHPRHDPQDGRVQPLDALDRRAVRPVPALRLPVRPGCGQVRGRQGHGPCDERRVLPAVLHERVRERQGHAGDRPRHPYAVHRRRDRGPRALRCAVHDLQLLLCKRQAQARRAHEADRLGLQDLRLRL